MLLVATVSNSTITMRFIDVSALIYEKEKKCCSINIYFRLGSFFVYHFLFLIKVIRYQIEGKIKLAKIASLDFKDQHRLQKN